MFIKIKTRDKIKCSQKNFMGGGRQFSWGKINPEKCLPGKLPPQKFAPHPPKKKKEKKKENWLQKILSLR